MNPLNFDEQVLQSELPALVDYWVELRMRGRISVTI